MDGDDIADVLDTLGDEHARDILAATDGEPRSAKELSDECDLSLATVYRRIDELQEYGLLTDHTLIADDGNHYKVFEGNFHSAMLVLDDHSFELRINRRESDTTSDGLWELWDDHSTD